MAPRRVGRKPKSARPRTPLARLMRERGHTYTWLAAQTGYSYDHVNAVATGRKRPTGRFLRAMAMALGVNTAEVV